MKRSHNSPQAPRKFATAGSMSSWGEYHPWESHSYTSDMPIAPTLSDRLQVAADDSLGMLHGKNLVLPNAAELQSLRIMRPFTSLKIFWDFTSRWQIRSWRWASCSTWSSFTKSVLFARTPTLTGKTLSPDNQGWLFADIQDLYHRGHIIIPRQLTQYSSAIHLSRAMTSAIQFSCC